MQKEVVDGQQDHRKKGNWNELKCKPFDGVATKGVETRMRRKVMMVV